MFFVGCIAVILCTFGGYVAMGGKLYVLWQPFEYVIICGSAIGAFIISNTSELIHHTIHSISAAIKGTKYKKQDYLDLLGMLYAVLRIAKTKGALVLESHVDNPMESSIFQNFPLFLANEHATKFLCDYLRLVIMGTDNPHQIENLMDVELETFANEYKHTQHAVQAIADGMPALGIVAAVLGVIKTMGSITEPPEVLGKLIGGALVGTFVGVFVAYGFVGPLASIIGNVNEADAKYYECIKVALIAYLSGAAPAVAVEFARKSLFSDQRPTFVELDTHVNNLPSIG